MSYIIGTTGNKVSWYCIKVNREMGTATHTLVDVLDLDLVSQYGDKETAKAHAVAAGLKSWRYFKF